MSGIRRHPNPFSQAALETAIKRYETAHEGRRPEGGVVVVYTDFAQGGALRFGVVGYVGEHLSFGGNLEKLPDVGKWAGRAEVAWAWGK